jgi:hypothetical protein
MLDAKAKGRSKDSVSCAPKSECLSDRQLVPKDEPRNRAIVDGGMPVKEVAARLWMMIRLLFLLVVANGAPVLAKKLLGNRFSLALDSGTKGPDSQALFGASKTVRGVLLSVLVTAFSARLVGLGYKIGALIGSAAMSGDLFSSFLKRRMRLPASSRAIGLDQVPESLFPLLVCRRPLSLTIPDIALTIAAFFVGEILSSRVLYKLHVRDRPY